MDILPKQLRESKYLQKLIIKLKRMLRMFQKNYPCILYVTYSGFEIFHQGMCFLGVPPTIRYINRKRKIWKPCPVATLIITATWILYIHHSGSGSNICLSGVMRVWIWIQWTPERVSQSVGEEGTKWRIHPLTGKTLKFLLLKLV